MFVQEKNFSLRPNTVAKQVRERIAFEPPIRGTGKALPTAAAVNQIVLAGHCDEFPPQQFARIATGSPQVALRKTLLTRRQQT